jgi:hypothetical protein
MSTYSTYALSGIKNKEILLAAIATMGLQAQVSEKAQTLAGFYSHDRARGATVVIPKSEFTKIGTYSYLDIGFVEQKDGTYSIQTDGHIPTMVPDPKDASKQVKFEDAIQTAYKQVNGDKAVKTILTKTIPRLKREGKLPPNATARKLIAGGVTKVLVSY